MFCYASLRFAMPSHVLPCCAQSLLCLRSAFALPSLSFALLGSDRNLPCFSVTRVAPPCSWLAWSAALLSFEDAAPSNLCAEALLCSPLLCFAMICSALPSFVRLCATLLCSSLLFSVTFLHSLRRCVSRLLSLGAGITSRDGVGPISPLVCLQVVAPFHSGNQF